MTPEQEAEKILKKHGGDFIRAKYPTIYKDVLASMLEFSATQRAAAPLLRWVKVEDDLPAECTIVWGYSSKWVDEDYNPEGVRECFYNDGDWFSAFWNNEQDCFENGHTNPTHWMQLPAPPSATKEAATSDDSTAA